VGEKAEMADTEEAGGQAVEQEATQELLDGKGHEAFLVTVSGVSPGKGNFATLQGDEAVIGNGHAVGGAAEIAENLFWATEGRFAVDHPVLAEEGAEERSEAFASARSLRSP
jgi:hypothetical protein